MDEICHYLAQKGQLMGAISLQSNRNAHDGGPIYLYPLKNGYPYFNFPNIKYGLKFYFLQCAYLHSSENKFPDRHSKDSKEHTLA